MISKRKSLLKWEVFYRFIQFVQTIAVVMASLVVFQIPGQIREWTLSQSNRSTDLLFRLEDRLRDGNSRKIITAIENNKPILLVNKGSVTTQDLDYYLNDLMSISDLYDKELIDCESVYLWFSNYFEKTLDNREVVNYINELRMIDKNNLGGLENFSEVIKKCDQIELIN